jgi:hypothetical protein
MSNITKYIDTSSSSLVIALGIFVMASYAVNYVMTTDDPEDSGIYALITSALVGIMLASVSLVVMKHRVAHTEIFNDSFKATSAPKI